MPYKVKRKVQRGTISPKNPTEHRPDTTTTVVAVKDVERPPESAAQSEGYAPGSTVKWPEFREILKHDLEPGNRTAGIHFAMLAPTRGGKTTLATKGLIPIYRQEEVPVLVIDSTSDPKLAKYGERLPRFGKMTELHRVAISDLSSDSVAKIHGALERAYKQGDILIYIDEIRHLSDPKFLGLGKALENLWLFGGKRGVTIGGVTQAPRWVPGAFYDQSKAHFLFQIRDLRSRKRIEEISGDTETLRGIVPNLDKYQFAYVSPDGDVLRSKYALRSPAAAS